MIYGSVCSGIEAASVAWHPLGWRAAFLSEIDDFPRQVLAHHYPATPLHGDFTTIQPGQYDAIELLVGGTPCQSFSVAGLRAGLADPRGDLMLGFGALAQRLRPRWLVWENVPGVLSSNGGRDFGTFLGMLGLIGYGFAYRVLDAQYVRVDGLGRAVPQRRRRVFVVGCLGDWRRAAAVLFERQSLRGDPAPIRKARQDIAAGTLRSSDGGSDLDHARASHIVPVSAPLQAGVTRAGGNRPHGMDADSAASLIPELLCVATGQGGAEVTEGMSPTLNCNHEVPYVAGVLAFQSSQSGVRLDVVHATLDSNNGSRRHNGVLAFDPTQVTNPNNRSNPKAGDPCHTLAKGAHAPVIAFSGKDYGADATEDCSPTLRAMGHQNSHENGGGQLAVAFDTYNQIVTGDSTQTLCSRGDSPGGVSHLVPAVLFSQDVSDPITANEQRTYSHEGEKNFRMRNVQAYQHRSGMQVRRLTPRECERLQGFPDDYTLITRNGKPAADAPRYKSLGNSMAVNVMRWIGTRIQMVEAMDVEMEAAS